jgi:iron(III) transport system permease protein
VIARAARAAASRGRRAPLSLAVPAAVTAAAALLPVAYLGIRAWSADRSAWRVLEPDRVGRLVLDTGLLVGAVVAASVLVGVPYAWLVARTDLPGRRLWAVAGALPLVIPSYVAALALLGALGPRGLLQELLEPLGIERVPEIYGLPGAVLALTLSTYPYVYLLVASALRELDPSLEEAARALGRSRPSAFLRVVLPALRPSIAAGALLVALYVLADFGAVSLMQYPSLTRSVYLQYQALFDREPAAILALVLVALSALVLVLEGRVRRHARYHRGSPGASRRAAPVRLGRWRWPATGFCALVVALFLALPLAVLVYWLRQAAPLDRAVVVPWREAGNSVLAATIAAVVAVAAAVPVAILAQRHPARWSRLLDRACFAGNALPGIVIALAIVFFAARYGWLYQTLALLVYAYVVRFLPQALAAVGATLKTVDPRLEEASRSLGHGRAWTTFRVTLPLVRPGLLAGAALVFLNVMKELPATLLLRPIGFDTLATEIWTATSAAAYAEAAPAALLLVAVSTPFLLVLTSGPRAAPPRD